MKNQNTSDCGTNVSSHFQPSLLRGFTKRESTAISWIMVVNHITSGALLELTERYRQTRDQACKSRLLCITPACTLNGIGKEMGDVVGLTGVSMVDFDHVGADLIETVRAKVNADPHTFLSYVTVSGDGLRVLFRYHFDDGNDNDRSRYKEAFLAGNCYYSDLIGLPFDEQCSNVNRLSAICHDPKLYFNAESEAFTITVKKVKVKVERDPIEAAEDYVRRQGYTYIEGQRNLYLMRVLMMLNLYGVPLSDAERWALSHDGLSQREIMSVVRSCYKNTAKHGSFEPPCRWEQISQTHNLTGNPHAHTHAQDVTELAVNAFPEYQWPRFLQQMVDCGDSKPQRDVILLSAITVLGAMLGKLVRFRYSHHYWHPSLQTFVTAPPASGKSCIAWARRLAEPLHDRMIEAYDKAMAEYETAKAAYDCAGKEKKNMPMPKRPALSMFLIAGNNSSSGILENLAEAHQHTALICESEADTISASISTDYGNWGDTLRKVHDHDRLSLNRRTNNEYRQIPNPCLAVLISGTPAQVKPLIPSAENGLFSRQLFATLPAIDEFIDQFGDNDTDYDSLFTRWGNEWLDTLDKLKANISCIELHLTAEQRSVFNIHFSQLFHHAGVTYHNHHMKSSVAREAINILRIMAVVALLRALENKELLAPAKDIPAENVKDGTVARYDLSIIDADFNATLSLAEPLYRTASDILTLLPSTEAVRNKVSAAEQLLGRLPLHFNRKEAVAIGRELELTETNIDTMLQRLVSGGRIMNPARGEYEFPSHVRVRENNV